MPNVEDPELPRLSGLLGMVLLVPRARLLGSWSQLQLLKLNKRYVALQTRMARIVSLSISISARHLILIN